MRPVKNDDILCVGKNSPMISPLQMISRISVVKAWRRGQSEAVKTAWLVGCWLVVRGGGGAHPPRRHRRRPLRDSHPEPQPNRIETRGITPVQGE